MVRAERCLVSSRGSGNPVSGATYTGFSVDVVVDPNVEVVVGPDVVLVVVLDAPPNALSDTVVPSTALTTNAPATNLFTRVTYAPPPPSVA
jgi:hypothetical protein